MKTYALSIAMNIFIIISSFGEIKNGYAILIADANRELKVITQLFVDGQLSSRQKQELKTKTRTLKNIIEYYEVTEQLLLLFKTISPELYNPIDTIKDCKGRLVNVYVKFIPMEEMEKSVAGTTNISHVENDEDAYCSQYGPNSVSVKIVAVKHSLILLAHEFGHISYQVPNLKVYQMFYFKNYKRVILDSEEIGHRSNDLSGQNAELYGHRFRQQYYAFLKLGNNKEGSQLAIQTN